MSPAGESQSDLYRLARAATLDAIEALGAHRDAVTIVGAQAIYLHVGDAPDSEHELGCRAAIRVVGGDFGTDRVVPGGIERRPDGRWQRRENAATPLRLQR